jgi:hypothetical protein
MNPVGSHSITENGSAAWWSARRRPYNIALVIAAPISAVSAMLIGWLLAERLPCLEITFFTLVFAACAFLVGLGLANICYFLGVVGELVVRPGDVISFRRWAYGFGLAFSVLLIFAPPIGLLLASWKPPSECLL